MNPDATEQPRGEARPKILVVDDNAVILKTLSFKLNSAGFETTTAVDAADAVNKARNAKPDLIVLDISFPPDVAHGGGTSWDGFQIMSWLRRIDELKKTPIIVITGGDPAQYEKRALDAGAVAFFHKPLNHEDLINSIRRALPGSPPTASPGAYSI